MSQGKALLVLCGVVVVVLIATKPHYGPFARIQLDDVTFMPDEDPAMQTAFKKARDSLDQFLALSSSPAPNLQSFSVKVAITQGEQKEYFWITPFTVSGDQFSGRVSNTPQTVSNVTEGQEIHFRRADIVDWTYENVLEKKTYGNFTACALLARESEEDAAKVKTEYGLDCDS